MALLAACPRRSRFACRSFVFTVLLALTHNTRLWVSKLVSCFIRCVAFASRLGCTLRVAARFLLNRDSRNHECQRGVTIVNFQKKKGSQSPMQREILAEQAREIHDFLAECSRLDSRLNQMSRLRHEREREHSFVTLTSIKATHRESSDAICRLNSKQRIQLALLYFADPILN